MGTWRGRVTAAMVVLGAAAGPAAAQDAYVSGSLTADVVRFDGTETSGLGSISPDGEALGFALRVGTRIGRAWGVEAEVARSADIENEGTPDIIPLSTGTVTYIDASGERVTLPLQGLERGPVIFPPIRYRVRSAYRDVVLSTGAWARQDFSRRFALVYSGGVGFHRTTRELEVAFTFEELPVTVIPDLPISLPVPITSKATTYSARPFAGIEGRIRMSDRIELVPGIRLHGLDGGLLVRPSIGLGWVF